MEVDTSDDEGSSPEDSLLGDGVAGQDIPIQYLQYNPVENPRAPAARNRVDDREIAARYIIDQERARNRSLVLAARPETNELIFGQLPNTVYIGSRMILHARLGYAEFHRMRWCPLVREVALDHAEHPLTVVEYRRALMQQGPVVLRACPHCWRTPW